MSDWLQMLEKAVSEDPRGMTGVAERIGYSRTAVSLAMAGKYRSIEKISKAVINAYELVACPYFNGQSIKPCDCRTYAARTYSVINANQVEHWRACQKCPNNTIRQEA